MLLVLNPAQKQPIMSTYVTENSFKHNSASDSLLYEVNGCFFFHQIVRPTVQ